jgi:hypothetical protein
VRRVRRLTWNEAHRAGGGGERPTDARISRQRTYRFSDSPPVGYAGVWTYRIRQVFENGIEQTSGTVKVGLGPVEPTGARILGNSPNPFTTRTLISVEIDNRHPVRLSVWDVSGHPVALLADRELDPGIHAFLFDGAALPSGLYFAVLDTAVGQHTIKMTLTN